MTITRLALHPREHASTVDVVDDRVHEEGALQVEQDAASERHKTGCAVLIIFFHPTSVCVTVRAKKNFRKNVARKSSWSHHRNSVVFCRIPVMRCQSSFEKQLRLIIIMASMVYCPAASN